MKDGKYHAIKCMKNRFESIDQVNNLREIQALRRLSPHEHVITLEEVLYDQPTGRLALVFELMDANLYELIRGKKKSPACTSLYGMSCPVHLTSRPSILVVEQHLVPSVQGGGIT